MKPMRVPAARPLPASGDAAWSGTGLPSLQATYAAYCLFALLVGLVLPPLKALYYLIPPLGLLVCVATRRFAPPPLTWPYFVLLAVGVATAPLASRHGWQDLYLMMIGVLPFALGRPWRVSWWQLFAAALLGTLASHALQRLFGGEAGGFEIDLLNSRSSYESPFCFVFGVLAVWAAATRRWKALALAVLMTVLTLKRIALIGVILTVGLMLLPRRLADGLLRPLPMIVLNGLAVYGAVLYAQGQLDPFIQEYTAQSANQIGMGRQALYHHVVDELSAHIGRYLVLGGGAGWAYEVMKGGYAFLGKGNLHADVMKILIEYGGLAFAAFFWMAYRIRSLTARFFWFFANVTLLTDNTLIYPYFIFSFCLAALCAERDLEAASQAAPRREAQPPRLRPARPWRPPR